MKTNTFGDFFFCFLFFFVGSAEAAGCPTLAKLASAFDGPLVKRFHRGHVAPATVAATKEGKQGLFGR